MIKLARRTFAAAALVCVAGVGLAGPAFAGNDHRGKADPLIDGALVGSLTTDQPIFGVAPGGADWSVSRTTATVTADGKVDVHVRQLVLTGTGANPVATISASLFCNGTRAGTVGPAPFDTAG